MQQPATMWRTVFFPYISYVMLFLGMGLISGSIVHMPVDPVRYTIIMIVGAIMFGFANFVTDIVKQDQLTVAGVMRALLFSLTLSVGIGMMSGGIQHFSDNPEYSAALIPLGFGLSLFSFIMKNRINLSIKRVYAVMLIFVALVLPLKLSLDYIVNNVEATGGHGHGGSGH